MLDQILSGLRSTVAELLGCCRQEARDLFAGLMFKSELQAAMKELRTSAKRLRLGFQRPRRRSGNCFERSSATRSPPLAVALTELKARRSTRPSSHRTARADQAAAARCLAADPRGREA